MTAPQPGNAPDPDLPECQAWAQPSELPVDAQKLHTYGTWCVILGLASDILWSASGRRWRNVQASETVTLDPPEGCVGSWEWAHAALRWGYGHALIPDARVAQPVKVRLPRPDVTAITQVTLGGELFTKVRLSRNWAIRTDQLGWPLTDSTRITYSFGRLVPPGAGLAAVLLATELGKALAGKPCQLPARVTSVTRQGISFDMLESLEYLKEGLTGVPTVDTWIRSVNPHRNTQAPTVWSPDLVEARLV